MSTLTVFLIITTAFSAVFFLLGLFNGLVFRRIPRGTVSQAPPSISVLVPMRNEAEHALACVNSLSSQDYPDVEILVLDDQSSDGTAEILTSAAMNIPRFRILHGEPLPEGWTGKNWACHQLAQKASGDLLVFCDADTRHRPWFLSSLIAERERRGGDLISCLPRPDLRSFWERVTVPMMLYVYYTFIPAWMIRGSRIPAFTAANGQVMLVTREAYHSSGGHEQVRSAIVEDVALARRLKALGHRIALVNGSDLCDCRMYTDFPSIWKGFSKNIYPGIGFSGFGIVVLSVLLWTVFLGWIPASLVALFSDATMEDVVMLAAMILMPMGIRLLLSRQFLQPCRDTWLHPFGFMILSALAVGSWYTYRMGKGAEWKGRRYHQPLVPLG